MSTGAESYRLIKNMPRSRSGPGGMGLKRQVKEEMMWTSVLNFHTLQAPGNSIRQAENPVTSGILPTATGPFICPPSVNLERGRKRMDAGLFQPVPGNKLRKRPEFLQPTHTCISTIFSRTGNTGQVKPAAEMLYPSAFDGCWKGNVQKTKNRAGECFYQFYRNILYYWFRHLAAICIALALQHNWKGEET